MNKTKLLLIVALALMLVAVPLFGACAGAPKHDVTEIEIYSFPMGTSNYAICFGVAEVINANSTWLRATLVESAGTTQNMEAIAEKPGAVIGFSSSNTIDAATSGLPPFKQQITTLRTVLQLNPSVNPFITLDPDIKTLADAKGKRISMLRKGGGFPEFLAALMEFYGVKEGEYDTAYLPWTKASEALADGTVDVAHMGFLGTPLVGTPAVTELMAKRDVYFIPTPPEAIKFASEKTNFPWYSGVMKAGPNTAWKEDVPSWSTPLFLAASVDMDEAIVYEVVRIMSEHASEFSTYHISTKGWTPEGFARSMLWGEEMVHPGSVKYFKEQGIRIETE